ncbi:MAG: DNA polymerase III subunit beta [Hyphomicrobiaceae bacterium]|nr:MAG: DNA polymerase III subunit beta [Hyphomicrobiaceae bacterium]
MLFQCPDPLPPNDSGRANNRRELKLVHALVDKAELDKALTLAAQVVRHTSPLPILKNLLLRASADGLRITGTNLDATIHVEVPCDCLESGSCTVPAKTLVAMVAKLPGGTVGIDSAEPGRVLFKYGAKGKFELPALPSEEFPNLDQFEHDSLIDSKVLAEMIQATAFCTAGKDTSRAAMKGLRIRANGGLLEFAGTDGHRMIFAAQVSERCPDFKLVAPRDELSQLAKLIRAEQDPVSAYFSENRVSFRSGPVSFSFQLIEEGFPNVEGVRPKENAFTRSAVVSLDMFTGAVARMLVVADEKQSPNLLVFEFSKEDLTVTVSANTPDVGTGTESMALESMDGDSIRIAFNGGFMTDFLRGVHSDQLEISMQSDDRSARFRPFPLDPAGLTLEYVQMPVRLREVEVAE